MLLVLIQAPFFGCSGGFGWLSLFGNVQCFFDELLESFQRFLFILSLAAVGLSLNHNRSLRADPVILEFEKPFFEFLIQARARYVEKELYG